MLQGLQAPKKLDGFPNPIEGLTNAIQWISRRRETFSGIGSQVSVSCWLWLEIS